MHIDMLRAEVSRLSALLEAAKDRLRERERQQRVEEKARERAEKVRANRREIFMRRMPLIKELRSQGYRRKKDIQKEMTRRNQGMATGLWAQFWALAKELGEW